MIDEAPLRTLLALEAEGIAVPEGGTDRIAVAVAGDGPTTGVLRSMAPQSRWGRVALAAAAVVVVVGSVSLVGGTTGNLPGHRSVAGPATSGDVPGASPSTTTVPSGSGIAQGAAASAGSNAPAARTPATGFGTATPVQATPSVAPPPLPTGIVGLPAKVVTTGTVDLALGSSPIQPAVTRLTSIASGAGGFVAKSDLQVGTGGEAVPSSGTLVLQIPQASFATVLTQVRGIGKVTAMTSTSTDVTGQYVDLQARIDALQASRQQYLTILSKATSIGDILSVQSQLDTIQSQIEQLQGQLDLLNSQTNYSTLSVTLSQSGHRAPPAPAPQSGIGRAWHQSVTGFTSGVEWLIRIAGRTLFVLVCLAVLAFAGRWAWRAWRRQML